MNVDRGKDSFTEEEVQGLRERLNDYKAAGSYSWIEVSKQVGVPSGTLSVWSTGKYSGDNQRLAYEVSKFFLADEERLALELEAPVIPDFQPTPTSRKIMSQLRWAQRGKMVVITGEAGVGKTAALEQYRAVTPNVVLATMSEGSFSPTGMLIEVLRELGTTGFRSGGMGGVQTLSYMLLEKLQGAPALLILDESQYLSDRALNQLRFLHDKGRIGVALAGNVSVMGRIRGGNGSKSAPFAQLHSRISIPVHYAKPETGDINILLDAWGVQHAQERAFLANIAEQPGCLRQVTMTLEAATLLARQGGETRTLSHMKSAWAQQARQGLAL